MSTSISAQHRVAALSTSINTALQQKIDAKTKPLGALGALESLAFQIGRIQNALTPELRQPHLLLFAADHGAVVEGISAYPKDVTWQMVENILSGGSASSVFARQFGITLSVADAGVDHDFLPGSHWVHEFIDVKIARGTANFVREPAMTTAHCDAAMAHGAVLVRKIYSGGCNVIAFGEMGIGNTSAAALLMHTVGKVALDDCIGRGAGLDDAGLARKRVALARAVQRVATKSVESIESTESNGAPSARAALAEFGGLEIAMMVGAMTEAASWRMILLIDGFIVSAALLVAARLEPDVLDYCVFAHQSDESGHRRLLELLDATPLLALGMRLGEGSGALLAYPLLQAAVAFLNDMASFESAGVAGKVRGKTHCEAYQPEHSNNEK